MIQAADNPPLHLMEENMRRKFCYVASSDPNMTVRQSGSVQYVDCEMASDTFNTVFGAPACIEEAQQITEYYRQRNFPAAWWLSPSASGSQTEQILRDAGWKFEERDIGMFHQLDTEIPFHLSPTDLSINRCSSASDYQDFGTVLSSIFVSHSSEEAENVRKLCRSIVAIDAEKRRDLKLFVGYEAGGPVATAAVFNTENTAGIFDISTHPKKRGKGFGSALFNFALREAQRQGSSLSVLQASPDGLGIYRRAGFAEMSQFQVWSNSQTLEC